MKKIGIITLFGLYNYGNRLQNYAMQHILEKKGYNVCTYVLHDESSHYRSMVKYYLKKVICFFINNEKTNEYRRGNKFIDFQKNIKTQIIKSYSSLQESIDYFVVGSDQVWNPEGIEDRYMLKFAPKDKRVAISASFGVRQLSSSVKKYYESSISEFASVSVREESGKKIINDLLSQDVAVLIDPTLMLDKDDWNRVSKKVKDMPQNYILLNFLGDVTKEIEIYINNIAKKYNMNIVNINDRDSMYYCNGPAEFITLIREARLICTDSFHSIVFSMIYDKDFVAYRRVDSTFEDMNSRLEWLLKRFDLEDRWNHIITDDSLFKCKYDVAHKVLKEEQIMFESFLDITFHGSEA